MDEIADDGHPLLVRHGCTRARSCLHNFPRFLQEYERPDGKLQDLAATDILRTRELGVPRYNEFRRAAAPEARPRRSPT